MSETKNTRQEDAFTENLHDDGAAAAVDSSADKTVKPAKSTRSTKGGNRRSRSAGKHLVYRTRHAYIRSTEELGALIRVLRLRTGMTQTEAAKACGVGRRWFNELENGKETIRIGMVIDVLHHFGASLTISGEGARFTVEELENEAVMKRDGEHVWEAEFKGEYEPNAEAQPEEPQTVVRKRGQKAGYISPRTKKTKNSVKFVEKD